MPRNESMAPEGPTKTPAGITKGRLIKAFVLAPLAAVGLYVSYFLLAQGLSGEVSGCSEGAFEIFLFFVFFIVLGTLLGAIPAIPATIFLAVPIYLTLHRQNRITGWRILSASFVIGVVTAYIAWTAWLLPFGPYKAPLGPREGIELILPAGVSAVLGGIIFCLMTIWPNPLAGARIFRIATPWILTGSFLAGFLPSQLMNHGCTDWQANLVPSLIAGLYTLAGGWMYCVFAVWPKARNGGAPDAPK